jgi:hypothetical protein
MEIIYDNSQGRYFVILDKPEGNLAIDADNIVKAKEIYIEHMTRLFDDTVNERFIYQEKEN